MRARTLIIVLAAWTTALLSPRWAPADSPGQDALDTLRASAEQKIAEAQVSTSRLERHKLLDAAGEDLQELIDATSGARSDAGKIRHLGFQLRQAELAGPIRCRQEVSRLMWLHSSVQDRRLVFERLGRGEKLLVDLIRRIDEQLIDWRQDFRKLVWAVPQLEHLRREAQYRLGWVRLYRGMAAAPEQQQIRRSLLTGAIDAANEAAAGGPPAGLGYHLDLLIGRAARAWALLAETDEDRVRYADASVRYLRSAAAQEAPADVRLEAGFEMARCLIERGEYGQAGRAIDEYKRNCGQLTANGRSRAEIHAALLWHYLYTRQAESVRAHDPAEATKLSAAAQEALTAPARRDADLREQLLAVIGPMYRGTRDDEQMDSLTLLAVAVDCRGDADGRQADLERATLALTTILRRDDPLSAELRPDALWQLGLVMRERGKLRLAAKAFYRLASGYPDHRRAYAAAVNSASAYGARTAELSAAGELVASDLRAEHIAALSLLTGSDRWAGREQTTGWFYELGYQCHRMMLQAADSPRRSAWMDRAIEAYEAVPVGRDEHVAARHWALELRCQRLERPGAAAAAGQARELVKDLKSFAFKAGAIAGVSGNPERSAQTREWAASADFKAAAVTYEVLGQTDRGLAMMGQLRRKWPGTDALKRAAEFRIRKLLENQRIAEAIDEMILFRDRHPAEADGLLRLMVQQIGQRIDQMRSEGSSSRRLSQFQQAYLDFAEDIFSPMADRPIADRYAVTQIYAEALLESGWASRFAGKAVRAARMFERALEMFGQCESHELANRSDGAPGDAANVLGVARALRGLGRYAKARVRYAELIGGIDMAKHPQLYWQVELEHCTCLLASSSAAPAAMKALAVRIRQLADLDSQMGGLAKQFESIAARAGKLAGA